MNDGKKVAKVLMEAADAIEAWAEDDERERRAAVDEALKAMERVLDIAEGRSRWTSSEVTVRKAPTMSHYERTRAMVYATGNRWAIENFNATH